MTLALSILPFGSSSFSFVPTTPSAFSWPWFYNPTPPHRHNHLKNEAPTPNTTKNNHNNNIQLSGLLHPGKAQWNGSSVWLPPPPSIKRPRATYNAASLAYLGDCVYELYVRSHFLSPPQAIDKYNNLVMSFVCCEAQDVLLKKLLKDNFLSEEERDVLRWGRNIQSGHKRATRRAGSAVYCSASSLETLVGYLYLTSPSRLEQVMRKLGFGRNCDQEGCKIKLGISEEFHSPSKNEDATR